MKKDYALFDMDGTLVDSMGKIFEAVCHIFTSQGVRSPTLTDYILNFRFPFVSYYRERGVKLEPEQILEVYSEYCGQFNPLFFDDATLAIRKLCGIDFKNAIITANNSQNTLRILESAGFESTFEFASSHNKVDAIREFVSRSSLGSKTPYFGDIIADILDAKAGGATPIGVLRNGTMELAQDFFDAGAVMCISSFRDIDVVLRHINNRPSTKCYRLR